MANIANLFTLNLDTSTPCGCLLQTSCAFHARAYPSPNHRNPNHPLHTTVGTSDHPLRARVHCGRRIVIRSERRTLVFVSVCVCVSGRCGRECGSDVGPCTCVRVCTSVRACVPDGCGRKEIACVQYSNRAPRINKNNAVFGGAPMSGQTGLSNAEV